MSIYQALDHAAQHNLLITFYRARRVVVVMDQDGDFRVEESFRAGGVLPGMAVIKAIEKHKARQK